MGSDPVDDSVDEEPHPFEEGPALSGCGICDRPIDDPIHDREYPEE